MEKTTTQEIESSSVPTGWNLSQGFGGTPTHDDVPIIFKSSHPIEDWFDNLFMKPGKLDFLETPYLWCYRHLYSIPKDSLHTIKNYYLRKTKGAGCCDIFSYDYYLARQILPGLKLFREKVTIYGGIPNYEEIKKSEDWLAIIDEMIFAFQSYKDEEDINFEAPEWGKGGKERQERITKGFELFGKYYQSLWY